MDLELVHGVCDLVTDVTHSDPVLTAKLVIAHLRKRADYYTRLVESEHGCPVMFEGEADGNWAFDVTFDDVARAVPFTQAEKDCHDIFAYTLEEAECAAGLIGIDFSQEIFETEDLRGAMNAELEHGCGHPGTDVTGCDPVLTAKLAIAHLRERADFYRHLEQGEGHLPR